MSWLESARIAVCALRASKLRSFLTILGIIIGVASVVTVVSVGAGAQTQIAEQIRTLGSNVLMIYSTASADRRIEGIAPRNKLSRYDAAAIVDQAPLVQSAAPFEWDSAQVIHGNRNADIVLWGTASDYFRIREWSLKAGRFFLPEEEESAGKQAILGSDIAQRLFGTQNAIGGEMRIQNVPFQVVGVLSERGSTGISRSLDSDIFIPFTTKSRRISGVTDDLNRDAVEYILVKVQEEIAMDAARIQIDNILRQRHRLELDQTAGYEISDPAAELAVQQGAVTTVAWLLASVATISLIVGGISIMNIMLVSTKERTREIGIRLAVGARRRDIRTQFLIEAVTLCLLGGLIGTVLSILACGIVAQAAGWPIVIGVDAILLATGLAVGTGIFFGWYPAHTASRLEPTEALRAE